MNHSIFKTLSTEFDQFQTIYLRSIKQNQLAEQFKNTTNTKLIENVFRINQHLIKQPFISGSDISRKTDIGRKDILLAYKFIQLSDTLQQGFKTSENSNYFNVVNHNFNKKFYIVVFFVGLSCPSRCSFCPNIKIDKHGNRKLIKYQTKKSKMLSKSQIQKIFEDLDSIKRRGYDILIKISGGLEPLTDIKTMSIITKMARNSGIPVKLFTNGLLLSNEVNRLAALNTNDIRISLCSADEEQYEKICFGPSTKNKIKHLKILKDNIHKLVEKRDKIDHHCAIGINFVVMKSNYTQLTQMIKLVKELGLDYIDFKPDYFSPNYFEAEHQIMQEIETIKQNQLSGCYGKTYINFVNSLSKDNFFWKIKTGECESIKQSKHKIFISPFGTCCPIHYGAFPHGSSSFQAEINNYTIGKISKNNGLLDILRNPKANPKVYYKRLNPFELILSLEIKREEEDQKWGIPLSFSPYHTYFRCEEQTDTPFRGIELCYTN
ncbi:MAG: radical SAM protein [Desulfobacteraceae bacterium]|nr:radical SAM protein [Desulfobacteraceae bacterium]